MSSCDKAWGLANEDVGQRTWKGDVSAMRIPRRERLDRKKHQPQIPFSKAQVLKGLPSGRVEELTKFVKYQSLAALAS